MQNYCLAVVGATGLVGSEMLRVLEEREFPIGKIILVASESSRGKRLKFRDEDVAVMTLEDALTQDIDIALFSAGGGISKEYAPKFARRGCCVIDNSSAWRRDPAIPAYRAGSQWRNLKRK